MTGIVMRLIFAVALLLVATLTSIAQDKRDPKFIDFNVEGVRLGDSESFVIEKLGKPRRRTIKEVDICGVTDILELQYRGVTLQLDNGLDGAWSVLEIAVTSSRLLVQPVIRVGATWNEVRTKFGESLSGESKPGSDLHYLTRDNDNADFRFRNGKLSKIRLWINPC